MNKEDKNAIAVERISLHNSFFMIVLAIQKAGVTLIKVFFDYLA